MSHLIVSVDPRSPAERAGVRAGDRLTHLQSQVVVDFLDYQALSASRRVRIRLLRDGRALETLNRDELRAMQTPQAFRLALLRQAHEKAEKDGFLGTDDAALLEHAGLPVYLTLGDPENLKLTTPADLALGEAILTLRRKKEALS